MYRICICGGGNLAHVVGGYLAAREDCEVRLLTRHPEKWRKDMTLKLADCNGRTFQSRFAVITSNPELAVENADIVFLCLPGFAIAQMLETIAPFVNTSMSVGSVVSSTGFFLIADHILPNQRLFGFQRVPFIARINEYGHSASLLGYKSSLSFATKGIENPEKLKEDFSLLFDIQVNWLDDYMKVTLTNSNPLLHPCRLFSMFNHEETEFDSMIRFYEDWDNKSSEVLIEADKEFCTVLEKLGIRDSIPSILDYYESHDASSLTAKIKSIQAFKGLYAPMLQTENGTFVPDYGNRYFTEDIPFGMILVKAIAQQNGIHTPVIDSILEWAQIMMGKYYIADGNLSGKDIGETIANYVL